MTIKELPIPPIAALSTSALEIVRVWAAEGSQHVSLATGLWPNPAAWGIMLADLARHVAKSYAETGSLDASSALDRIREALDAELSSPTEEPSGELLK